MDIEFEFSFEEDGFMICGDKSCFAATKNINEIDAIMQKTF